MNLERIDLLLRHAAESPRPSAPAELPQNVWRAIASARRTQRLAAARLPWSVRLLGGWWGEPRLALASVVLAAVIGAGLHQVLPSSAGATGDAAADLAVFSTNAPALPSTLLAVSRARTGWQP